jgi:very-short-patch-repair endonuclease
MQTFVNKLEFITRQLAKAQSKKFEHYVVHRIWHRLGDLRIKVITQQFVSRPDGRAMTDLYFPQLGLHVEIDEAHHLRQLDADRAREADIINATNHEFLRITVKHDLSEFDSEIDAVIETIRKRIETVEFTPWDPDKEMDPQTYIDRGYMDVDEDVAFRTMADAASCFGRTYTILQKSFIPHSSEVNTYLWFPKLYENAQWHNTLSKDEKSIIEICKIPDRRVAQVNKNINNFERNGRRLVFARVRSPLGELMYRFKGEYLLDLEKTNYKIGAVFNRVSKRVKTYASRTG